MKKIVFIIMLFPIMALAETTLRFSPRDISLGESTQLIFETTQAIKTPPDFSSLQGNFAISNQEQSSSSMRINGRRMAQNSIILTVFPRKEGELSTGDILFNGQKIEPATVIVKPASAANGVPVTFEAYVNMDKAYVQGMILYTVKLTDGAGLMGARMTNPEVEGASVIALNMDKTYQEQQQGQTVGVIERTYGIIPEKEGLLTIKPIELYAALPKMPTMSSGDLFAQGMLFNGFSDFQKELRFETKSIQVEVRGKPATWVGWWLPATSVSMVAEDQFPETINVGDSLMRTIQITAVGVEGSQLPVVTIPAVPGVKIYPSPEQRDTIQTPSGEVQGVIKTSVVMVPNKNGKITLPAISVPWFNVQTGTTEFARLPAKTIQVAGTSIDDTKTKADTKPIKQENKSVSEPKKEEKQAEVRLSWVIGMVVGGIVLGLGLGFFIFHHKKHRKSYRLIDEKQTKKKKKALPDLYPL